jgi:hypothetical protein
MTNRLGTCAFAYQIQELYREKQNPQPHDRPELILAPELYVCRILECTEAAPPPPVERAGAAGEGFLIRPGDCEACAHYQPAGGRLLVVLLKSRTKALKRRGRKPKVRT